MLLAVLEGEPCHGYAVISSLRQRSDGEFDLPEGTIYPALHRLEKAGLIGSRWEASDGRRRRVYSLSGPGARTLQASREEWERFATGMHAVVWGIA